MKRLFIVLTLVLMPLLPASGDDVIGGGTIRDVIHRDFQLPPQIKNQLIRQGNLDQAFNVWVQSLSPSQQEQVLEKVFKNMIVPQISN